MKYLFTSTPANNRQTTSELFATYGNPNQIPGPVGQSGIIPLNTSLPLFSSIVRDNFGQFLAASVLKKDVPLLARVNLASQQQLTPDIFEAPDMAVSFEGKGLKEKVVKVMDDLGFSKQSSGKFTYYKGRASQAAVNAVLKNGGDLDTPAPYGLANIRGYLTFVTVQKLVLSSLVILKKPLTEAVPSHGLGSKETFPKNEKRVKATIKSADDKSINFAGIFLPYFGGLCLPDKEVVPDIISRYFSSVLGATDLELETNMRTIRQGWRSLATSPQGIVLSHVVFCFDIAMRVGARMRIYMPSGQYGGVLLQGENLAIMKSATVVRSLPAPDFARAVREFDLHESKLQLILDIFNSKFYADEEDDSKHLVPANVTTPRFLHNLLRNVVLSTEETQVVRKALQFLRFAQHLWSPTDEKKIIEAGRAISEVDFLDDDAPIAWTSEAFFAKDIVLSTLAAFGMMAPSLSSTSSNYAAPILTSSPAIKEKMSNGVVLRGIPIYVKPLQEAAETWKEMRRTSMLTFKTASIDKQGYTRLPGVTHYVAFDEPNAHAIAQIITKFSAKAKEKESKKRARDMKDATEDASSAAATKKIKLTVEQDLASFAAGFFGTVAEDSDNEMEM